MSGATLEPADRAAVAELAPVVRRVVGLDPGAVARLRFGPAVVTVLMRLPFGVLVSRTVTQGDGRTDAGADGPTSGTDSAARSVRDTTVGAVELLDWLDGTGTTNPPARDADWRGGLPPASGWRRLETLPDSVIRPLVRQGALTLRDAAAREGVPGAQPRREVADALLDSVVLEVNDDSGVEAAVTLRAVSALTRMGFLPRGGQAHVDTAGRWIRVVGGYGTVYLERAGSGLGVVAAAAAPAPRGT